MLTEHWLNKVIPFIAQKCENIKYKNTFSLKCMTRILFHVYTSYYIILYINSLYLFYI